MPRGGYAAKSRHDSHHWSNRGILSPEQLRRSCRRSSGSWRKRLKNAEGTRPMKKKSDNTLLITTEYRQFIEELKLRVISAQISAARRINHELILLYWDIGSGIVAKQQAL